MKKITSTILGLLSIGVYLWLSNYYAQATYDYNIGQFVSYLFYWSVTLFIVSLFALVLESKKYKIWLYVSAICLVFACLAAYMVGDGNGTILSFDGKLTSLILAGLYTSISLLYFIVQFIKNRRFNKSY